MTNICSIYVSPHILMILPNTTINISKSIPPLVLSIIQSKIKNQTRWFFNTLGFVFLLLCRPAVPSFFKLGTSALQSPQCLLQSSNATKKTFGWSFILFYETPQRSWVHWFWLSNTRTHCKSWCVQVTPTLFLLSHVGSIWSKSLHFQLFTAIFSIFSTVYSTLCCKSCCKIERGIVASGLHVISALSLC